MIEDTNGNHASGRSTRSSTTFPPLEAFVANQETGPAYERSELRPSKLPSPRHARKSE